VVALRRANDEQPTRWLRKTRCDDVLLPAVAAPDAADQSSAARRGTQDTATVPDPVTEADPTGALPRRPGSAGFRLSCRWPGRGGDYIRHVSALSMRPIPGTAHRRTPRSQHWTGRPAKRRRELVADTVADCQKGPPPRRTGRGGPPHLVISEPAGSRLFYSQRLKILMPSKTEVRTCGSTTRSLSG